MDVERSPKLGSEDEQYRRYSDELTRFANSLVGPADAADAVAEAVLSLLRSGSLSSADNPRALMYTAVLRSARSMHRSAFRRRRREQQTAILVSQHDPEIRPDVIAAVLRLSPRHRACVYLTYWLDWPTGDVAGTLGISTGAVKRHLARARHHLRRTLDD